jgi:hypothetical protein
MRMLFTAAALALTVTPALAAATDTTKFEHDGVTYVYSTTDKGGTKVIRGRSYPGAKPFDLVVRNGVVTGTSGYAPVSFRLSDVERVTPSNIKVAAR